MHYGRGAAYFQNRRKAVPGDDKFCTVCVEKPNAMSGKRDILPSSFKMLEYYK